MWLNTRMGLRLDQAALAAARSLMTGLTNYWRLDEVSGNRADAIGSVTLSDNFTVGCSPSGPSGTVANFVTVNSERLESTTHPGTSGDYTMAIWARAPEIPNTKLLWVDNNQTYMLVHGAPTFYQQYDNGPGIDSITHQNQFVADSWHYIVCTMSSGKMYLWVNGIAATDNGKSLAGSQTANSLTTWSISFGGGLYWNGWVGRAGFWSRALTGGELTSLFNSGHGKAYDDLTVAEKVGLVSYWDLDEASGDRYDSVGYPAGNNLTDYETVGSVVNAGGAMHNTAASFVAANGESLSYTGTIIPSASDFTVAVWYKDTGIFAAGIVAERVIAGNKGWIIASWNDGKVYAYVGYGTGEKSVSVTSDINEWHLGVLTYNNSTRVMSFCVDDGTPATDTLAADYVAGDEYFQIGFNNTGISNTCLVDEVGIWNRVLEADEITELYAAGAGKFLNTGGTDFA